MVRKIVDEQIQYDGKNVPLSFTTVYDRIKRSNSSLNRKSKRLLEDSIERVIAVVREDHFSNELDSGSDGGDAPLDEVAVKVSSSCSCSLHVEEFTKL